MMIASHDVIVSTSSKRGNSESLIAWGALNSTPTIAP